MKIKVLLSFMVLGATSAMAQDLPSDAQPGKCYIKCITADEFVTEAQTVQVSPAYKKLRTIPATFKTITERVLVKEGSVKKIYVPAVYETITVNVPAGGDGSANGSGSNGSGSASVVNYTVVPASFGQSSQTFVVSPEYGKWEYTELKDCPSANKEDCMVACFVQKPSRSVTIPITTLNSDAKVVEVKSTLPGASYRKQVVKTPAQVIDQPIPEEYSTVTLKVVDVPAKVIEENVPAQTKTVSVTKLSKQGGMTVWEEVDCKLVNSGNILPINYEVNSAVLTEDSKNILDDNLVNLMNSKPNIRVEIMSFTDSRGDDAYNMSLSQQRAQSVVNYLVSKGINRNRLVARGYGETKLKNNCSNGVPCTDAQHAENRRTEFRILK